MNLAPLKPRHEERSGLGAGSKTYTEHIKNITLDSPVGEIGVAHDVQGPHLMVAVAGICSASQQHSSVVSPHAGHAHVHGADSVPQGLFIHQVPTRK